MQYGLLEQALLELFYWYYKETKMYRDPFMGGVAYDFGDGGLDCVTIIGRYEYPMMEKHCHHWEIVKHPMLGIFKSLDDAIIMAKIERLIG